MAQARKPRITYVEVTELTIEELQKKRCLVISINDKDDVEYSYPGMSSYEAQALTGYVSHHLQAQLDQHWGIGAWSE